MRALTLDEHSRFTLCEQREAPAAGVGEALIRPLRVGISGLDVEICRGLFGFRGVPGRAFVGVVEAVGDDHDRRWVGRRVVGSPIVSCAACDMCRAGLRQQCRDARIIGMRGRDGALASHLLLPVANLCEVPADLDDERALFADAVAAAIQVSRQLRIEGKPYITVLGDGLLGLLAAQVLSKLNASVRLLGTMTEKLSLCERWGIAHRHVDDVGRRADQDCVVDCTGSPEGLELAMKLVRPRGTIVLKSLIAPEARAAHREAIDLAPLVMKEIELVGSFAGPIGDGLACIGRGEVDVLPLISRRFRLEHGRAIFEHAARPESIMVVVDCSG